jgi:hypothetical protein
MLMLLKTVVVFQWESSIMIQFSMFECVLSFVKVKMEFKIRNFQIKVT